nr:uncharacterized protein LOC128684567 [Cherax quadricarinatus]
MQGPGWRCGVILVLEVLSVVLAAQDAVQDISDEGLDSFGAGEVVVEGAIRLGRSRSPRALRGTVNGGTPGHDFPTLNAVPATNFNCHGKKHGYYADVDTGCQVFHVCQADGRLNSFLCPNSTIFHQRRLVCDWWYNVKCDASAQYFDVNLEIGKVPAASTRSSGLTGGARAQGSGFSGGAGSQVSGFSGGAGSQGSGFSGSTGSQRSGFSRGAGSQGSRFSSGSGSQRPSFFGGAETQGSGFSGGSGSQASTFTEGAGTQGSGFTGSSGSQVSSFTGGAGTQGSGFSGGSESQASSFTGGAGTQGSGFSGNSGSQVSSFTLGAGTQGSSFSRGSGSQASSFTGGAGTQASGSGRVTGQTPFQAAAAAPQTRPLGPPVTLPSAGDHSRVSGQGSFTSSRGLTPSSARPTLIPAAQVTPSGGSGTFASRVQGTLRTSQTPPRTAPRVPVPTFPPITSPAPTFPPHTTPAHTSPAPTIPTPTATRAPTLIGQAPTRSFTPTRTFAPARVAVSKRPVGTSSHFGVSLPSLNRPPADGVNLLISGIQSSQILDNVADVRDAGFGVPLPSTGGNQATQSVSNQNRIQTTHRFQASQGVSLSNTRSQSQPSSFQSDTRDRKIAVGQPALPVRRPFTTGTPSRGSATFSTRTRKL